MGHDLGGRYDYATTSTLTRATNSLAENHDQQFSWRGGINYLFDNGISPYFSYSESFEPVSGSSSSGKPFDPSRGKQYEAGVKYVPKDMPVVVTAAVYQLTKDKNLTADPANQAFSIQTGEIRSRGLELEAKAAVNANINLTAAYSYTDAEYTHDTVFNGKRPAEVPRNMASLWADYTFHETALSGLTIGAGARYIGSTVSYYKNDTSTGKKNDSFSVAGYALMDATVKYDLARFGLPGSSVASTSTTCSTANMSPVATANTLATGGPDVRSSPPPPSVSNHLRARFAAPFIRLSLCRNRLRTQKPPSRWIASLSVCLAARCSIRSRSPSRLEKSQA